METRYKIKKIETYKEEIDKERKNIKDNSYIIGGLSLIGVMALYLTQEGIKTKDYLTTILSATTFVINLDTIITKVKKLIKSISKETLLEDKINIQEYELDKVEEKNKTI